MNSTFHKIFENVINKIFHIHSFAKFLKSGVHFTLQPPNVEAKYSSEIVDLYVQFINAQLRKID